MTITWTFAIDLNKDGDFSDTYEDISSYVMAGSWELGFSGPYDPIAKAETLTLTLKNGDKRFSPEYASSPLYPNFTRGRVIKIQSNDGVTTRTHFTGRITSIIPDFGESLARRVNITVEGYFAEIQRADTTVEVMENVTADEVIEAILSGSNVYPPGFAGRWRLGIVGFGELGNNTILGALTDYLNAETGVSTFTIIGDQWGTSNWGNQYGSGQRTTSVYGALRDVVGREGGRLFINRAGVITFWNRHHLILDTDSDASLDNNMLQLGYSYGDTLFNDVAVTAAIRTIGSSNEVLGFINEAVEIKANSTKEITYNYLSTSTGATIAGKNAVAPVGNTDFTANGIADGSGTDYTGSVTAAITSEGGSGSTVTFTNAAAVPVWVEAGSQIRGIKITDYGEVEARATDGASILEYGRFKLPYDFTMDSLAVAEGMAGFLLDRHSTPVGIVSSLEMHLGKLPAALGYTIGDRLTIIEDQIGISTDYFIISEQFNWSPGGSVRVVWGVEPAASSAYWILGVENFSELGETTFVGPF